MEIEIDEEKFCRVYKENSKSIPATAKAFSTSQEIIEKYIERYKINIKRKNHRGGFERGKLITKEVLEQDYLTNGLTVPQISVKYDVSKTMLYYKFKLFNIQLRKESRGRRLNLVGEKYGLLTVIKYSHTTKRGRSYWLCECECGNKSTVASKNLRSRTKKGRTISCGCMKSLYTYGELEQENLIFPIFVWKILVRGADHRNIEVNVSPEYISNLYIKQNGKCALSGVEICFSQRKWKATKDQTASLDRIDSNLGYVEGNLQWIHKDLQLMKMDKNQEDFIKWCKTIAKYNND